jgi:hypothetical protein
MDQFAREPQPKRTVMIAVRVAPAEAAVIDGLASDYEGGRCGVLRAGLDALLRERERQRAAAPP